MILTLPENADAEQIAHAIDAENVESWLDESGKVRVAVNPWYSTKDVDQTVLCTIKVVHVLLGLHATNAAQPKTWLQKMLVAMTEVIQIQKAVEKNKNQA